MRACRDHESARQRASVHHCETQRTVESLKAVARMRGFTAYQTLLKSRISEGLRRDEVQFDQHTARKLADALKRRGVAEKVLQEAMAEITHG